MFFLDEFEVLNIPASSLPAGRYTIYFGIDTIMDGRLNVGNAYYDAIPINVVR
ncbi:hypothetical protein [Nitrosomonas sp. ANs5]|uniref:hypothetical protein n=1 Tax=Nitrosomonas sp. ANs5 TaxID=3423941 RepID=UPI003D333518